LRDTLNDEYDGKIHVTKVVKIYYSECAVSSNVEYKIARASVLKIEIKFAGTYESAFNFELQVFFMNP